jgi:subtilisin family serine protease
MDGMTTRISIAAGIASRKGMIPVNSAGNSGSSAWHYISAPADAIDILAVGATGNDRQTAPFSSRGPSVDGRVKPDVAAVGWGTAGLAPDGQPGLISGTSFSCPLVAGATACLWQLHPDRTAQEIMAAVRASASQHNAPDDDRGFGIPDFWRAHLLLGGTDLTGLNASDFFAIGPLPFDDHFDVTLYTGGSDHVDLQLFDATGRVIWEGTDAVDPNVYMVLRVGDGALQGVRPGAYVLRASTESADMVRTVVKLLP